MIIYLILTTLVSNALTTIQERGVLYSRSAMLGMLCIAYIILNSFDINFFNDGISLYNGLFNITLFTQSFNLFILLLASLIAVLNSIYPNKVISNTKSVYSLSDESTKAGKLNEQFNIIEYALITLFILSGAMFLMSTGDLISLFLSIELQSYGLYILATLYRDSESATSSGLTYFLLGGLSSCFILLGSAILYVNSGTTNLDNIYIINSIGELTSSLNLTSNSTEFITLPYESYRNFQIDYINLSFTILIVGFLFKISAAPFHFWSPDVYDGIPTVVTTFVAIIAKISLFAILIELINNSISSTYVASSVSFNEVITNQVFNNDMTLVNEWKNVIVLSSLVSLIIGSLLGLTQYRIKRLFAYSTISHVGFILLALAINKMESIQGYIFYILQYSLSNLNAFLLLITIGYSLSFFIVKSKDESSNTNVFIDKNNSPIQFLNQLKGYFYVNQFLAISLAITLFSFIGIPPLIGFFAKQMVLSAALDEGYIFITLVGVITSVIGAAYYLNIVRLMFFNTPDKMNKVLIKSDDYNNDLQTNNPENTPLEIGLNDYLTTIISSLTMIITLFIFTPSEWFRIISVLALSINNT